MIHLDTSFLVDLLRESGRKEAGPATELLNDLGDEELAVSVHVACELYAGVELSAHSRRERGRVEELLSFLRLVPPAEAFAPRYGKLLASIQRRGDPVATMDLLIGTAALLDEAPLVTRNARHFLRIPGLEVIGYGGNGASRA